MNLNREAVYSALWGLVAANPAFVTASRILQPWSTIDIGAMPAIFQSQTREIYEDRTNLPPKVYGRVNWWLYTGSNDASVPPSTQMNQLRDLIDGLLLPSSLATVRQTLGGLVGWARIDGTVETDEGTLGPKAVAIIPIRILFNC